jgi:radical SAM protein with 4Fe4S-binding SPASM domain
MKDHYLDKCIKEINESEEITEVVLGGIGEPTFADSIERVIEELKDKKITITTNGTLLSESLLESMVDNVDHIVISVDGDSEVFNKIRNFPLQTILDNVKRIQLLKEANNKKTPKMSFQMVLTSETVSEIMSVLRFAHEYKVDQVILSNIIPSFKEDEGLVAYKMYEREPLKSLFLEATKYALMKRIELKLPEIILKTERRCRFVEDETMVVTAEGNVAPCYRLAHNGEELVFGREKIIEAHYFGHIEKQTLKEIWDTPEYSRYRHVVLNNLFPSCMDCDLVDGCDMARHAETDCYGNTPTCADCLWSRKIVYCI